MPPYATICHHLPPSRQNFFDHFCATSTHETNFLRFQSTSGPKYCQNVLAHFCATSTHETNFLHTFATTCQHRDKTCSAIFVRRQRTKHTFRVIRNKITAKMPKMIGKSSNMAPRWPKAAPIWPQDGPKHAPRWPKMALRWPKVALRLPPNP